MASIPKCPKCNTFKSIQQGELYWCTRCCMLHDGDPDEGGDYAADPSRRMEREEERRERKAVRRG